jgi:hypothetical protein
MTSILLWVVAFIHCKNKAEFINFSLVEVMILMTYIHHSQDYQVSLAMDLDSSLEVI